MSADDQPIGRGQAIAAGRWCPAHEAEDDGPRALALAVLRQMVKDARAGDAWAAWCAWVGAGFGLAMGLGLAVETWEGQLRQAGISRPEREPPAPLERNEIEPPVLVGVFRQIGEGEPLRMGEIHRRGRPRKGQAPAPGKGWLEFGLAVRVEAADWEGRDIVRLLGQMLTRCAGDGRAAVAELVQDSKFVTRVLCWADLAE